MSRLQWIKGNKKLQKTAGIDGRVVGWGIPADHNFRGRDGAILNTCLGALACRGVCYAKQGAYLWRSTVNARNKSLAQTMSDTFVADAIADLGRMRKVAAVRIHDSGDFYSQEYLDSWSAIAAAFPKIIFYAYTKSLHLDFSALPSNFRVTQSLGGKFDGLVKLGKSHARIFATDEARVAAGYIDGMINDRPALDGLVKIGLVYHGNKKLTTAQSNFFA
jgi:hypothetical protein